MTSNDYTAKENYLINITTEERKKHIYSTLFEENKTFIKGKCLFLGCNKGNTLPLVKEYCDRVVGIDINREAIVLANKEVRTKEISFAHCNVLKLPFLKESFDTIIMFDFWEHIYKEDQERVLEEIYRVMKWGGHLLFFSPHSGGVRDDIAFDKAHVVHFRNEDEIKIPIQKHFNIKRCYKELRSNPGNPEEKHDAWFGVGEKKRKLTVVSGQIWSGKTTYARKLQLDERRLYLDFDMLFHYYSQYLMDRMGANALDFFLETINKFVALHKDFNIVVDGWFSWCFGWENRVFDNKNIWEKLINQPAIKKLDVELVYLPQRINLLGERYVNRKGDESITPENYVLTCNKKKEIILNCGIEFKCFMGGVPVDVNEFKNNSELV